jgi:hypothetical protein
MKNGNILRRNRRHIKETGERFDKEQDHNTQQVHEQEMAKRQTQTNAQAHETPKRQTQKEHAPQELSKQTPQKTNTQNAGQIYRTKSGRASVKPAKLNL